MKTLSRAELQAQRDKSEISADTSISEALALEFPKQHVAGHGDQTVSLSNPNKSEAPMPSPTVYAPASHAPQFDMISKNRRMRLLKRFELPLLLCAGLMPAMAVWTVLDRAVFTGAFTQTMTALIVAISFSWFVLSKVGDHARARHLSYVLPVNIGAFLGVLAALALLRIPYSGSLFASGAVFAIAASFVSAVYSRRFIKTHIVIGGGRANEITLNEHFKPAPSLDNLDELIDAQVGDWAIVADLHYPHPERAERLFAKAALSSVPVYHFRSIAEMQSGQVRITHLSENDLGSLIPDAPYTSLKRLIDVLGASILIPLLLPVFACLAILIMIDSRGSAFFIQERVGFRGRKFKMIKFRTMRSRDPVEEARAKREDAMTNDDDKRITRVGGFLRKTRIDELPQVFNIMRGDMSFIGPRPEACALSEWYEAELPFYSYRHIVRPGITGWAQVNQGHVTNVNDVHDKLRFDFYYIKNLSLWLDVLVALKTVRVIVTGTGAR